MKYFETTYLGKPSVKAALKGNLSLQKMLSSKAIKNSTDSKAITTNDLKKMKNVKSKNQFVVDVENFINPFEF
jgi:hypothetical protein